MSNKPSKSLTICNGTAEFLIFTNQAGEDGIEVRYQDETIWLTQKLMAELFDVGIPTINEPLKNIFKSGELQPDSVIRNFRITAADGKRYNTRFYSLDAISVDSNKDAPTTREFFANVQNKLHYAIHGKTAAELIKNRADSSAKI